MMALRIRIRNTISCSTRNYDANRLDLLNSVNAILLPHGLIILSNEELLKIILYGHEQLSFDSNAKILTANLENIQASKRVELVDNEKMSANSPLSLNSFLFFKCKIFFVLAK